MLCAAPHKLGELLMVHLPTFYVYNTYLQPQNCTLLFSTPPPLLPQNESHNA